MVSEDIDKFIQENGGNVRDALNVALARLQALTVSNQGEWASQFAQALDNIFSTLERVTEYTPYGEDWVYVVKDRDYIDLARRLLEDYNDFLCSGIFE